jgi:hypothetical protein
VRSTLRAIWLLVPDPFFKVQIYPDFVLRKSMPLTSPFRLRLTLLSAIVVCAGGIVFASTTDEPKATSEEVSPATVEKKNSEVEQKVVPRIPIAVARDRAKLMHEIYLATLEVMHDRYFHADRAIVPARAMEDVFSHLDAQTGTQANWISVNLKAMSINHEPKTDFEKRAAREIVIGETEIEEIKDGMYRRASAIPMTGGCISCHGGFFKEPSKAKKFTGLVISIPIVPESADQ